MKKISLLTILFFSVAVFCYGQSNITLRVDMTDHLDGGGIIDASGMHVAGNFQIAAGAAMDWTPAETPLTDTGTDNIWETTVMLPDGDYEYKFVLGNDWPAGSESVAGDCAVTGGNRFITVAGADQTVNFCYSSCDLCGTVLPTTMLTLTINDLNDDIASISIKGLYDNWNEIPAFDDGTNGDATAGDGEWTLVVEAEYDPTGSPRIYQWGAVRTDCAAAAWLIQGPDREFTVDVDGSVTGDTNYDIPLADVTYNVTFRVYMGNELTSNDGIAVSGSFETCAWTKMDLLLTQNPNDTSVWEVTTAVSPGIYEYKYFNGELGTDDKAESTGDIFTDIFISEGCGVAGTQNRALDLSDLDADRVLEAVIFNSCDEYFLSANENQLKLSQFDISPNPARSQAVIEFTNDDATAFDLVITNITGQTVRTINNVRTNRVEVSVKEMAAGMYFATLRNQEGATVTRKLIVR